MRWCRGFTACFWQKRALLEVDPVFPDFRKEDGIISQSSAPPPRALGPSPRGSALNRSQEDPKQGRRNFHCLSPGAGGRGVGGTKPAAVAGWRVHWRKPLASRAPWISPVQKESLGFQFSFPAQPYRNLAGRCAQPGSQPVW